MGTAPRQQAPAPAHTVLGTARLVLRPLSMDDVPTLNPVFSDPDSMRYWSHLPHETIETTVELFQRWTADDATGRSWAVTRDGGTALGFVNLFGVADRIGSFGYMLAPAARGQGFATEAGRAVLGYAFGAWNMHRVEARLDPDNRASARVLERLGFTVEGHTRKDFLLGDRYYDTLICGMLADEWRALSARAGAAA